MPPSHICGAPECSVRRPVRPIVLAWGLRRVIRGQGEARLPCGRLPSMREDWADPEGGELPGPELLPLTLRLALWRFWSVNLIIEQPPAGRPQEAKGT
jgi:hypothetical protein